MLAELVWEVLWVVIEALLEGFLDLLKSEDDQRRPPV
jgi:hypothetical protein